MPRKSRKAATPSLSVEDQIEAEITAIEGTLPRIAVEVAASEPVVPAEPVNEGPVALADVSPADADAIEASFEDGEFIIPDGRALAHAFGTVTDDAFTAVCGRSYPLAGAMLADAMADRCAYCEDGTQAPADVDDEPATLRSRVSRQPSAPVALTDPQHVSQFTSMLADLTAYVDRHGNGADARAFYAALTHAAESLKPLTKRDRSRPASTAEGTRTYVRVMPTGRVSVSITLNGETVSVASMGDACRKLAACMPAAEKCAAYVKRVDELKMTANARVYLQADIDAGRIPADIVTFGTK